MKLFKVLAVLVLIYAAIVTAFESLIGYRQPRMGSAVVITTFDAKGEPHDRVVSKLESGGHMYVAANHWPRAWYRRALANPDVRVEIDGAKADYHAVPVSGEEHDRVAADNPVGTVFRILTGFPPRYFVRLDPKV
jgi:hypothetical protein